MERTAHSVSEVSRMMAEDKSLRQGHHKPRRKDLYMWIKPEETTEWKAKERITALEADKAALVEALKDTASRAHAALAKHGDDK